MQDLTHKSSKTKCSNQGSASNYPTDLSTRAAYKWQNFTQKLQKSPRPSKEEKQAMGEGGNVDICEFFKYAN